MRIPPVRRPPPILWALAAAALAGGAVLYLLRPELVVNLATNPRAIAVSAGVGVALVVVYLVLRRIGAPVAVQMLAVGIPLAAFLAWTLVPAFLDVRVDETLPDAAARPAPNEGAEEPTSPAATDTATSPADEPVDEPADEPVEVAAGSLSGRNDYRAEGQARLLELPDGGSLLRLEDLDASNGPDLRVYLTSDEPDASGRSADYIDLGALKGNQGNQNYEVPAAEDLSGFEAVVIWCRVADAAFGVASLR